MVTKTEVENSGLDTAKLGLALLLVAAGIFGFYYFEAESQLLRVLGILAIVLIAFLVVATTAIGRKGLGYAKDSRLEVRKVVWPTRQETVQTTIAVLVVVLIVAIMLWLVDMFLGWGVRSLLS